MIAARCLHPGCCGAPAPDGYLCPAHTSRRRPPVRVSRTPAVTAAYARAWADHDLAAERDPRTALRDRYRVALDAADRAAQLHLRAPTDETRDALARARARVVGALAAVGEVV